MHGEVMRGFFLALMVFITPAQAADLVPLPAQPAMTPWPTAVWPEGPLADDVDAGALTALLDRAFDDPAPDDLPGTRAVLIVHRGVLVVERYAPGFSADRKFLSQSVAKTVTAALAGIVVGDGLLAVDAPAPVLAWSEEPDDPRRAITIGNLLQMSSGLVFNESYFNPYTSDALPMLFGKERGDMAAFAASKPLEYPPGTRFAYASGTTNLLSGLLRDAVGGDRVSYLRFMNDRLFAPIGMTSAEPEFDERGTFVGSSWLHATARDWARLGLLLVRGGVWDGQTVLPPGWVDYMRTPLVHQESGIYGAQTWLNAGNPAAGIAPRIENLPADTFMGTGHGGQMMVMVPSKDLVVIRFGKTGYLHYGDLYRWLGDVAQTFPDVQ